MLGLLKHLVKQTYAFMSRIGICILISIYVMVIFVVDAYLLVDYSSNVWPSDDCTHQQQPWQHHHQKQQKQQLRCSRLVNKGLHAFTETTPSARHHYIRQPKIVLPPAEDLLRS